MTESLPSVERGLGCDDDIIIGDDSEFSLIEVGLVT